MKSKLFLMTALIVVSGLAGVSFADVVWTGDGTDDLWSNADNWQDGVLPALDSSNVILSEGNDDGNDTVIIDESTSVEINNDMFGPEWGITLIIDGGSMVQTNPSGFVFAPIGATGSPSVTRVQNGGNLQVHNLLLGDNWWYSDAPAGNLEVYDTSTVLATDWCWLGGKMNLYGGSVTVTGGFNMDSHAMGYAQIDIEEGELILSYGDVTETVEGWIEAGQLTAYGQTPGRGVDVVIDTVSVEGSTVLTAINYYPAEYLAPEDGAEGIGTLIGTDLVDVTLEWNCGGDPSDPNALMNPNTITHYIYMTDGTDDPNLYYTNISVDQISTTDPYNSYVIEDLSENTYYEWSIVEGLDDGTGTNTAYLPDDPNNILGPIWSFTSKAAQPSLSDPVNDIADPDGTFTVVEENGVTTEYQWFKVGDPEDEELEDNGIYSGTNTSTLVIEDATINEEGQYYCIGTNGPKYDVSGVAYLWTQRLMGYWKFDQDMLDYVNDGYDITGAAVHNGEIGDNTVEGTGDPNYVIGGGINGSDAMQFFNDGDYVAIGGDTAFFNFYPLGFTVNFWYKQNASIGVDAWRLPVSKLDGGTGGWLFGIDDEYRDWMLFFTNPEDGDEYWADGSIDVNEDGQNDINIGDGQWHMVTAVYDPDSTAYTIFTDGDENETIELDLSDNPLPDNPLCIGGINGESSIDGYIDEVSIYSFVKTPLEIANMYLDVETEAWVCVEDGNDPLDAYDFTNDCKVDLEDYAVFASKWLSCQRVPVEMCD